jgi:hypothetical protein
MESQSLTITGRSFYKFRALMDASLEKAVEKMLAAGVSEGTVSGQISIKLDRSVNDETGEVTIRPRFVFNTTLSVPVKISEKDETNEDLVLFRDEKSGRLKVCENQVTMDDIMANSEIVPDADPEAELAKQLTEAIMDAYDEDPDDEEPAEDDPEAPADDDEE